MKETGKVIEVKSDIALVELARTKACKACKACLGSSNADKMLTEARNLVSASVGDEVYLEVESRNVLLASMIVYIIPLFSMILGYLLGSFCVARLLDPHNAEAGGITLGFVGFVGSYFFIGVIDKRISKTAQFDPVITGIVE